MSSGRGPLACNVCGAVLPAAEFYPGKRACKSCHKERSKAWARANPERVKIIGRRYRATPKGQEATRRSWEERKVDPAAQEKARAQAAAWRERNRERHRAYARAWTRANPERARASAKKWREENPERDRENHRRWREENRLRHRELGRLDRRKRYLGRDTEAHAYAELIRNDPCSYCGEAGGWVDHIVPLSGDGENHWTNLTSACGRCNASKRSKSLLRFLLVRLQ